MVIYRAWTHTDAVAAVRDFLAIKPPRRSATRKLMEEICSSHPAARKRATDLARLVSARDPGILREYAAVLMDVLAELIEDSSNPAAEWQSCGYLMLASARNATTPAQRQRLAGLVRPMLDHSRTALRASALEAFCRVAAIDRDLREEARVMLQKAAADATPALRARGRGMSALLQSGRV